MSFICLLRGCHWRPMPNVEINELQCHCCERCGTLRYSQRGQR
ncbi:PSPA7_2676 family Cys-rich small protein [Pseudomonas sp. NBRC 111124]|nr:PSPA7_2676 family Cys-rich small protein [Pseudomonas sp. NBRC 111124]